MDKTFILEMNSSFATPIISEVTLSENTSHIRLKNLCIMVQI